MDICLRSRGIFVVKVMVYLSPKSRDICQKTCLAVHVSTERACNRAQVSMAASSAKRIRYLRSRKHFSEIARRHHAHKLPYQMLIY